MEPIALSVSDAVKASGLGKTTLYQAMAEGRLESRKVGRRRLVITTSLHRLIGSEA
jgi:excisionase family DNA binding protein